MHLLLVRFSSLGDIVLQSSFISFLKFSNPKIKISFLTSKGMDSLLKEHRDVDFVYAYKKERGIKDLFSLKIFVENINKENKIDFIIDLHGTTRSSLLRLLTPFIPSIVIDKRRIERHFLIHCGFKLMKYTRTIHSRNIHDLLGCLSLNKNLDEYEKWVKSSYDNSKLKYSTPLRSLGYQQDKTIIIAPVASFAPKRWSILNYKELILKILADEKFKDYQIINLAGADDHFCNELNSITNERFINLQGKTTLLRTTEYIAKSEILIGNDSGLGHIAESFGVKVISIFGPTHESLGFKPHLESSFSISKKMWCRPCSGTGKKKCFRFKQHCLKNITPEEVFHTFNKAMT